MLRSDRQHSSASPSMLSDRSIQSSIQGLVTGGRRSVELTEPSERGGGRLKLLVRLGRGRTSAEWFVTWYRGGRRRMAKLGCYPTLSLAKARSRFRNEFLPEIADGQDPTGPRALASKRGTTIERLFESYVSDLERRKKPSAVVARRILLGTRGVASALGPRIPASAVRTSQLVSFLAEIHARGAVCQADSARSYLRAAFEFGIKSAANYHTRSSGMD